MWTIQSAHIDMYVLKEDSSLSLAADRQRAHTEANQGAKDDYTEW